jgi:hypothetical protein
MKSCRSVPGDPSGVSLTGSRERMIIRVHSGEPQGSAFLSYSIPMNPSSPPLSQPKIGKIKDKKNKGRFYFSVRFICLF